MLPFSLVNPLVGYSISGGSCIRSPFADAPSSFATMLQTQSAGLLHVPAGSSTSLLCPVPMMFNSCQTGTTNQANHQLQSADLLQGNERTRAESALKHAQMGYLPQQITANTQAAPGTGLGGFSDNVTESSTLLYNQLYALSSVQQQMAGGNHPSSLQNMYTFRTPVPFVGTNLCQNYDVNQTKSNSNWTIPVTIGNHAKAVLHSNNLYRTSPPGQGNGPVTPSEGLDLPEKVRSFGKYTKPTNGLNGCSYGMNAHNGHSSQNAQNGHFSQPRTYNRDKRAFSRSNLPVHNDTPRDKTTPGSKLNNGETVTSNKEPTADGPKPASLTWKDYHCQLCDVWANSERNFTMHVNGKMHKMLLKSIKHSMDPERMAELYGDPNKPVIHTGSRPAEGYIPNQCRGSNSELSNSQEDVTNNETMSLNDSLPGQKVGQQTPKDNLQLVGTLLNSVQNGKTLEESIPKCSDDGPPPILDLEYVQQHPDEYWTHYWCKLCDIWASCERNFIMHVRGRKHKKVANSLKVTLGQQRFTEMYQDPDVPEIRIKKRPSENQDGATEKGDMETGMTYRETQHCVTQESTRTIVTSRETTPENNEKLPLARALVKTLYKENKVVMAKLAELSDSTSPHNGQIEQSHVPPSEVSSTSEESKLLVKESHKTAMSSASLPSDGASNTSSGEGETKLRNDETSELTAEVRQELKKVFRAAGKMPAPAEDPYHASTQALCQVPSECSNRKRPGDSVEREGFAKRSRVSKVSPDSTDLDKLASNTSKRENNNRLNMDTMHNLSHNIDNIREGAKVQNERTYPFSSPNGDTWHSSDGHNSTITKGEAFIKKYQSTHSNAKTHTENMENGKLSRISDGEQELMKMIKKQAGISDSSILLKAVRVVQTLEPDLLTSLGSLSSATIKGLASGDIPVHGILSQLPSKVAKALEDGRLHLDHASMGQNQAQEHSVKNQRLYQITRSTKRSVTEISSDIIKYNQLDVPTEMVLGQQHLSDRNESFSKRKINYETGSGNNYKLDRYSGENDIKKIRGRHW